MTDQRRSQPARGPTQPAAETHWREVHRRKNADYLFAEDIGKVGTQIDVEIVDSGVGEVQDEDGKKKMPWVSFKGARKKLGLGRTGCKTLESLAGTPIVQRWRGWITLVVIKTTYTDRKTKLRLTTDAIRIAPARPERPRTGRYIQELPPEELPVVDVDAEHAAELDAFDSDLSEAARARLRAKVDEPLVDPIDAPQIVPRDPSPDEQAEIRRREAEGKT